MSTKNITPEEVAEVRYPIRSEDTSHNQLMHQKRDAFAVGFHYCRDTEVKELMEQRDEAVRLLGQLLATVRALPGDTEIGFDGVMTLKRCDTFLKSLSTT